MIGFYSKPIDLNILRSEKLGKMADFAEACSHTGGNFDEVYRAFGPYLSLCRYATDLEHSPEILDVGVYSDQRKVFGDQWAKEIIKTSHTPDPQLRQNSADGYMKAVSGAPTMELCEAEVCTLKGQQYICWARVIAPLTTRTGHKFFALFGTKLDHTLQ